MIVTPPPIIVMPSYHKDEPSLCPKCGKEENIINVCKHCGYEYTEKDDVGFWDTVFCLIIIFVIIWILATLGYWVFQNKPMFYDGEWEKESLRQIISNQFKSITDLFKGLKV